MLARWFLDHPRRVDETYLQHQRMAWGFSADLLKAAAACFIHGLIPALFETTASRMVGDLQERMVSQRKGKRTLPDSAPQPAALARQTEPFRAARR